MLVSCAPEHSPLMFVINVYAVRPNCVNYRPLQEDDGIQIARAKERREEMRIYVWMCSMRISICRCSGHIE